MMYAASNFLTSIGFNVPYVFTVDRAREWDMTRDQAAFLLSTIGIANTLARYRKQKALHKMTQILCREMCDF